MPNLFAAILLGLVLLVMPHGMVMADGALDGRVFSGKIGPAENPDLDDSLHFNNGHFWSDICTRCGFQPGKYSSEQTEDGIRFTGTLISDSRGQFDYEGLVKPDGTLSVSIAWERKRWYWTARREIVFTGTENASTPAEQLTQIRLQIEANDPGANPLCARF